MSHNKKPVTSFFKKKRRRTTEAEVVAKVKKEGMKRVGDKGRKVISTARASEAKGLAEIQHKEKKRKNPFRYSK